MILEKALRTCGFPCEREKLLEVLNDFTMDDPAFGELFFGPLGWTAENHTTTGEKGFQVSHWDEDKGEIVNVLDEPLRLESLPMEAE